MLDISSPGPTLGREAGSRKTEVRKLALDLLRDIEEYNYQSAVGRSSRQ